MITRTTVSPPLEGFQLRSSLWLGLQSMRLVQPESSLMVMKGFFSLPALMWYTFSKSAQQKKHFMQPSIQFVACSTTNASSL